MDGLKDEGAAEVADDSLVVAFVVSVEANTKAVEEAVGRNNSV